MGLIKSVSEHRKQQKRTTAFINNKKCNSQCFVGTKELVSALSSPSERFGRPCNQVLGWNALN